MNDAEVDKLIDAFLNGELDDTGRRRLAELQETDPVVREMFDEALNVEALLYAAHNDVPVPAAQIYSTEKATATPPLRVVKPKPATRRRLAPIQARSHAWVAVAAAALLMIAATLYYKSKPDSHEPEVVKHNQPAPTETPKRTEVAEAPKPAPVAPVAPKNSPPVQAPDENLVIGPAKTPPDKAPSVAEITPKEPPPLKITKPDEAPKNVATEAPKNDTIVASPIQRERPIPPPPPPGTESGFIAVLLTHAKDVALSDDQVARLTALQKQYQSVAMADPRRDPEIRNLNEQRKMALNRGDVAAMNALVEKIHAREAALGKGAALENPMALLNEEQSFKMKPFLDRELPMPGPGAPNFATPNAPKKNDDTKFTSPLAQPNPENDPDHPPPPGPPGKNGKGPPPGKGPPGKRPPPGPDGRPPPPLGPDGLPLPPPPDGDDPPPPPPPPGPPGRRGPPK